MPKSDLITVCGLWINETKNGDTYLSGTIGNIKIMVFKNQRKEKPNHPDYNLVIAPKKRSEKTEGEGNDDFIAPQDASPDDDIPF